MDFMGFFWLLVWAFFFVAYLMVLFQILIDVFRDSTMSGWAKAIWVIALIAIPLLTALVYLIARGGSMNNRRQTEQERARQVAEDYIASVSAAVPPSQQIANAKELLDTGAISQAEYDALKAKVFAS